MKELIVFGLGKIEREIERYFNYKSIEIVAFSDNREELWGKVKIVKGNRKKEVPVINPKEIKMLETDIVIASSYYKEIEEQLLTLGIEPTRIINGNYQALLDKKEKIQDYFTNNFWKNASFYEIEDIKIKLPSNTLLPIYQRSCPMYNCFFPFLAKIENRVCKKPAYILDIGANVGDTLVAMIKYTNSSIIAVEPTEEYFEILQENVSNIPEYKERIKMVKAYITYNENDLYDSIVKNGTAMKKLSESSLTASITIPNLLKMYNVEEKEVSLIKIDTDGYDAECILSCEDMLKRVQPILYWENQIDNIQQYELYNKLSDYLLEVGYKYLFIFDNFGNYLCEISSSELKNINNYLMRINSEHSTRTFYYVDILACKAEQREQCKNIINEYNEQYLFKQYL